MVYPAIYPEYAHQLPSLFVQATLAVLAALQLAYVFVIAASSVPRTRASLATAIVCLVSTVVFICLSELEHTRSPRPSHILTAYFFLSCLLDIIRARTLWMIADATLAAGLFTATLAMRGLVLFLEWSPKTHALIVLSASLRFQNGQILQHHNSRPSIEVHDSRVFSTHHHDVPTLYHISHQLFRRNPELFSG